MNTISIQEITEAGRQASLTSTVLTEWAEHERDNAHTSTRCWWSRTRLPGRNHGANDS